jgi:hypothetical protein
LVINQQRMIILSMDKKNNSTVKEMVFCASKSDISGYESRVC